MPSIATTRFSAIARSVMISAKMIPFSESVASEFQCYSS